ncbi:hypothetical protein ASPVEDRAFT_66429 [Aspergillus versicolor CBS 583.65]|uniref:Uncharacterized protein n=1 Tax=Aspergillus versicolor CBS 583.65 TaxID=1036611 RepID=A0A1L9Q3V8_ASPVE|nr:uncharacterized protein ASPVEDRAFT_66429 [Aspergillus versicolor CBS 583.65]OJJ08463.1 hypothetical protein ASPVEDRAFT_66429 [Aspergillus versicolor CBS 583.65]
MLLLSHYVAACVLCYLQHAAALPQGVAPSQALSVTSATPTETLVLEGDRNCDFNTMDDFFKYAHNNGLNITVEVQNCQNLCLLTYGVGNPDLSGIGMMYAYSIQTGLTILVGPVYRILYLAFSPVSAFIRDLKDIQVNFFSSNAFFVGSSALATLAHLSQSPSTFEVAEMQAMAFLQVNSILVTFFCLVVTQPVSRWAARVILYFAVFVLVTVALGKSHLGSDSRKNWQLASDGCAHSSTDYSVINPVPYPGWTAAIFAVAGTLAFWLQTLKGKFQDNVLHRSAFKALMLLWVLLIGLLTAGMVVGVVMMWRQRRHLRSLARDEFEDDEWGFGQIAALTIWAPIPVELIYILNDLLQRQSERWHRWNASLSIFFYRNRSKEDASRSNSDSQPEVKANSRSGSIVEVSNR